MRPDLISIRLQLIVATLGVSLVVVLLFLPFARRQVEQGFETFEIDYVAQERSRLSRVLQDQAMRLGRTAIDYSRWNDTVEYLVGTRPQWIDENLTEDVFANFGVNAIVVANANLDVVAVRTAEGSMPASSALELVRASGLCARAMEHSAFTWRFAWIDAQPHAIACAPILPTDADPPQVVGAMAWSMLLDETRIADIRSLVQFPFELHAADSVTRGDHFTTDRIATWLPLENFDGSTGLIASLDLPRPLGPQRELTTRTMLLLIAAAVCIPSLLMLVFLETFVARRIRRVSHWVRGVRRRADTPGLSLRPPPANVGFAELGMLTHDFAELTREMENSRLQWQSEALHDSLTGLGNRPLLLAEMAPWLAERQPLALFLIDLDGFKAVNDLIGHPSGDVLLSDVADILRQVAPPELGVYRLGGDEFAMLWPNFDAERLEPLARGICDAVRVMRHADGKPLLVTTCVGVGTSTPAEPLDASRLLAQTDLALYEAKRAGRATHRLFSATTHACYRDNLALSTELTAALAESRLLAWFQPVVSASTRAPIALEALARWHEPRRGWIPPVRFIGVAEHAGQVIDVDIAVMRYACAAFHEFRALCPTLDLHVNVSARSLADRAFLARFDAVLLETAMPSSALCLELTESDLNTQAAELEHNLQAMRDRGVRLVVDDFGVGASSLGRVSQIGPHALKIDGSFVRDLAGKGGRICRAIVELSHELEMVTIAEFVEDDDAARTLLAMHCDALQGYGVSRPLPVAEMLEWLRGACGGNQHPDS